MKLLRKSLFRLVFVLPFLIQATVVYGQSDPTGNSAVTRTYAITNATIVPAPGKMIKGGTLLISDGLISAVGTNVTIPDNAEVIDGTGYFIYPGFIDGMSYTGAKRPENKQRPDDLFTPDPPNDYAGITPELSVLEQLDVEENSISNLRKSGFTISHTVPYGRMLPGTGSLILLGDKSHPDEILLAEQVSMYTQFVGAPGAYPGNTLGIMAKWRNLYHNARLANNYAKLYASNPTGLTRPTRDRVLEAYFPVVEKKRPVFYNTPSMLQARRAMRLQDELDFNLTIGNLKEAWPLANELKDRNTGVFLSLDLPDKPEISEDEDKSEEVKKLEQRRMEFYNKQVGQYHLFDSLGIKFGFSTMDASASKLKNNLITITQHGLDTTSALAALTINAAELLGIENIAGTLEAGKIANAIVTTGSYFSKDSNIKYVFVDGDKYELEIKKGNGSPEVSAKSESILLGTWDYSLQTPEGEQTGTIIFSKSGDTIEGVLTSNDGTPDLELINISFFEGSLGFDFEFDGGGQLLTVNVYGEIEENEFTGTASIAAFNMSIPMTAVKQIPNWR